MYSSYHPYGQQGMGMGAPYGQQQGMTAYGQQQGMTPAYGQQQGAGMGTEFVRNLERAINGEYSAIQCYQRLAGMAPNQEQRNLILEIRNDEIRHYHYFTQLYTALTGRQPSPKITEECPSEYRRGLRFSFEDEQKTVDFYLKMSDMTPDMATRDMLRRIAADEQQHAVWFLSLLTLPYPGV